MTIKTPAYQWYKFGGANLQAVYGNGTLAQAETYCRYLNRNRDIDLYGMTALGEDDAEATKAAGGGLCDIAAEGINLDAEIDAEIDALPRVVDGEVHLPSVMPMFDGDGRFWLSAYGDINPRELARLDGVWYVRWPGFSWRLADENKM